MVEKRRARAVLVLSTVANICLMAMKLSVGYFSHSRALIADGINSTLDIFFSIMILLSFRWASKPPDKDHPYGHGNIEVLVAFIASIIILATGGIIIYDGIRSALKPQLETPGVWALVAEGATVVIKLSLYLFARSVAKRERSPAVAVQAADHRSDILSTSAALTGIFLARLGVRFFDPIGAALVGVFIIWTGIRLVRENLHVLLDAHPEDKFFAKIQKCLKGFKDIESVPHMRAHPVGTSYFLEVTITVEGTLSVLKGHAIAERVRSRLLKCEPLLKDVIVHVEPAGD